MEGLSAKVFRTFNASLTLQDQLKKLTNTEDNVNAKILSYNRANRAVAILCNHQVRNQYTLRIGRSIPGGGDPRRGSRKGIQGRWGTFSLEPFSFCF
jgi:hypothetical protein